MKPQFFIDIDEPLTKIEKPGVFKANGKTNFETFYNVELILEE